MSNKRREFVPCTTLLKILHFLANIILDFYLQLKIGFNSRRGERILKFYLSLLYKQFLLLIDIAFNLLPAHHTYSSQQNDVKCKRNRKPSNPTRIRTFLLYHMEIYKWGKHHKLPDCLFIILKIVTWSVQSMFWSNSL